MEPDWQSAAQALAKIFPKNRLERRVRALLEKEEAEPPRLAGTPPVALACSGGADSLAALLLAWAHFPALRERFFVLHFNHAVRGAEADNDELFVRAVSRALGLRFFSEKLSPVPAKAHCDENFLRERRLDFFARAMRAQSNGGAKILLQGHQRDDVAETLLMRLTRGAGTAGLAAPRAISPQADGRIFARPLLGIGKNALRSALRANAIPWREDETNAGEDYFRSRVRKRVLPALCEASPCAGEPLRGLARSRELLEEDADALEIWSEKFRQKNFAPGTPRAPGEERAFAFPRDLPRAIVRRLVWKIFAEVAVEPKSASVADALVDALDAGAAQKFSLPGGQFFAETEKGGVLRLRPKNASVAAGTPKFFFARCGAEKSIPLAELPVENANFSARIVPVSPTLFREIRAGKFSPENTVFLSMKNFAGTRIFVRAWEAGERFRPLGSPGEKTVGNAFTDKKIPRERRAGLPVFADENGVAWVPCLPPAERFRLGATDAEALRLTYSADPLPL